MSVKEIEVPEGYALVPKNPPMEALWHINDQKPLTIREMIELYIEITEVK